MGFQYRYVKVVRACRLDIIKRPPGGAGAIEVMWQGIDEEGYC